MVSMSRIQRAYLLSLLTGDKIERITYLRYEPCVLLVHFIMDGKERKQNVAHDGRIYEKG